jgi:hypothetical protein
VVGSLLREVTSETIVWKLGGALVAAGSLFMFQALIRQAEKKP